MLTDDAGMTLTDPTSPTPVTCGTCHALTLDASAHAGYHAAVAAADPIVLPDNIPAAVD